MKMIPLTQGKFATIDDGDYEYLNQWKWCAHKDGKGGCYAVRNKFNKLFLMHRVITNAPKGMMVDHRNGDGLDNRRENLRVCTASENRRNSRLLSASNKSGYRGVCWNKEKESYKADIRINKRTIFLGSYSDPIEAAHAYDKAAKKYFGEFAQLNFPD